MGLAEHNYHLAQAAKFGAMGRTREEAHHLQQASLTEPETVAISRSEMPTPVGDHSDDPQVAAFLAMVETEAKLRATIAELRTENATLRQHIEEFCSRDTASEIAIEDLPKNDDGLSCRRCGKPKQPFQVFCGAVCSQLSECVK